MRAMRTKLTNFINADYSGGILLFLAAVFAIVIANVGFYEEYDALLHTKIGLFGHGMSVHYWINDGLMAIFFFLVGMEIKREILMGELSSRSKVALPVMMAIGGMVVPAGIYFLVNADSPHNFVGWAIPAATDIAFSLGVLALLGSRVPLYVKVLLTAVAIIDDVGAIVIIALFYTSNLNLDALLLSAIPLIGLFMLNWRRHKSLISYLLLGLLLWFGILQSGIHASLAGVVLATTIPMSLQREENCLLRNLEHKLHPWVTFGILPLFALANSGIHFEGLTLHNLLDDMPLGIILGLVAGKPLGIFGFMYIACHTGLAKLPFGARYAEVVGLSFLCGIGFTMSLFIGTLAFDTAFELNEVKMGVLGGSLVSAILGVIVMYIATAGRSQTLTPDHKLPKSS